MARLNPLRSSRLAVEPLEDRWLPANLQMTGIDFLDGLSNVVAAPVEGSMYRVRTRWTTDNLTASDSYIIRVSVDGVALDSTSITGVAGTGLAFNSIMTGWYAGPGGHSVTATLDAADAITETNEGDNVLTRNFTSAAPTGLPAGLFQWPIAGVPGRDWSVVNYNDVDPRSGQAADFRGGPFVYDGHNAFDITLPNFARMDAGVPIFAAAGGTVSTVVDDLFDRSTGAAPAGNNIAIDHGNGWSTIYYHIAKFTSLVSLGDTVVAGQPIALVGSSGNSSDAHLHFAVYYRGLPVETMFNTGTFFAVAPAYEGDVAPSITDSGISNSDPGPTAKERPNEIATFATSGTSDAWFWYRQNHVNGGDAYLIKWYRPDTTLDATYSYNPTSTSAYIYAAWVRPEAAIEAFPGTWNVALERNGTEILRKSFTVTTGVGVPEVSVLQGSTFVISGRTTPIDFGPVALGGTAPQLTFTIQNTGTAALNPSSLQLPPGYSPVGAFPSSIAAGASATFTVRLDTSFPGTKFGAIRFATNDSDESSFWFNVTGRVTGSFPSGSPAFTESSAFATLFRSGFGPVLIAPNSSLTDPNSPLFTGGSVTVRFAAPVTSADALSVRNQGTGPGLIGLSGTTVTYGGVTIGTAAGGAGNTLTIALTSGATLAAVQALLRNLTYSTTSSSTAPRYLAIQVTDNTGLVSDTVYRTVLPMATADVISIAPVTPNPTANPVPSIDVTFSGLLDATTFTSADLSLTRNGGPNLIDGTVTISSLGGGVYRVGNLSGLTNLAGSYVFSVNGTGIRTPNQIPGSTTVSTTWDNVPVRPTATITRGPIQPGSTNLSPVRFVVTFSEPVSGFDESDVSFNAGSLTAGLTSTVSPNGAVGNSYFVDVLTINGTGTVGIAVADGAASSVSGGLSQPASTPPAVLVSFDNVLPVPAISPAPFGPTNLSTIPVTITFSEPVATLLANEVQLVNATMTSFTPVSATQYTFDLHPIVEGAFSATVPAGVAADSFTNLNSAVSAAGVYDITAPVGTINQAGIQADPTNVPSVRFTAIFSEPVAGLDPADIDFTGSTAPGTLTASVSGSGTTFNVTVIGMTGDGRVKVKLLPNAANDPAGNASTTSPSADDEVTYDSTPPTVTINQASSQSDPVNTGPIAFTVVFSEPVTNFTAADILFTGSTVGGALVPTVIPGIGSTYTVLVTGMTGDGLVVVSIPAGAAQDLAGNNSAAATFTDNSVRFDSVAPTATITQAAGQNDPTSNSPVLFTIAFSEPVSGFNSADLDFSSSTVGGFLVGAITGTGPTYTVLVSGMSGVGTIVLDLPAGHVTDAVGNGNTAASGADRQVSFFTITLSPFLLPDGVVGTAYSTAFSAGGHPSGNVPYGYSISGGTLPPGLTLSSTGVLSGTPLQDGSFTFTVQAITQDGDTGARTYTVAIAAAPIQLTIGGRGDGTAFQYSPDAHGTYVLTSVVTPFGGGSPVPSRTAVADINDDGVPDTIFVTGPGTSIRVSAVSGKDNSRIVLPLDPFGGNFTGGGFVAAGDLDGDGRAEFVVTPDEGGGPRVTILSLQPNGDVRIRANFLGIDDANFRGGARPAMGDVDNDGIPDLIVAAGFGGGPRVALFDGETLLTTRGKLVADFFAFPDDATTLRNGTFPALGDISGDGYADLIFGGGPGGAPRVYILSGQLLMTGSPNLFSHPIANFFVDGNVNDRGGVHVAAKDADGDSKLDLIVGSGENVRSRVRIYLGADFSGTGEPGIYQDLDPFQGATLADGVFVG